MRMLLAMNVVSHPGKSPPELRRLARVVELPAPEPGFAGPGHTAVEVLAPRDLTASDPFVLLMDDRIDFPPGAQVGGPHPHAGLETVTFVVDGSAEDRDEGQLEEGDAVWMTAGRGVIHNEEVRVTSGRVRILQLWVTLPEKDRAAPPRLDVLRKASQPVHTAPGVLARVYSGQSNDVVSGTFNHVPVTMVDVHLEAGATFEQELPAAYNGFVLPLAGAVEVGSDVVREGAVGWLARTGHGGATTLRLTAGPAGARVMIYAGERQDEPTVQHGPFVAGSMAAIGEMARAYRAGRFTPIGSLRSGSA